MIRGLYVSASGMMADALRLDVVANNLANAGTTGYKRDTLAAESFADLLIQRIENQNGHLPALPPPALPVAVVGGRAASPPLGLVALGAAVVRTATRLTDGPLRQTGRPLDVAIQGDGFFSVQTAGGVRYTRQGSFQRDGQGILVTAAGHPVLVNGEAVGQGGTDLEIRPSGEVLVDGTVVGSLDVVPSAQTGPLRKEGAGLWGPATDAIGQLVTDDLVAAALDAAGLPVPPLVGDGANAGAGTDAGPGDGPPYRLHVRFLETANLQPVLEMVEMISAMRGYEAGQRAIQAQDDTLGRAVNEVGKL